MTFKAIILPHRGYSQSKDYACLLEGSPFSVVFFQHYHSKNVSGYIYTKILWMGVHILHNVQLNLKLFSLPFYFGDFCLYHR